MLLGFLEGPDGIIVIVILVVLIFGGAAIPKLARNLGSAKNEFEKGLKSAKSSDATTPGASQNTTGTTPTDSDTPS